MELTPDNDAFGAALVDQLAGRLRGQLELEVDDGRLMPALSPAWFFQPPEQWDAEEHELLAAAFDGPAGDGAVLDLGAGAGRHALYLQSQGREVTALDSSPGAIEVCRARGVVDARLGDLTDPPRDRAWGAVLLLCGNLGLAGGWGATRALLARLARVCAPGAVVVADTTDPNGLADEGAAAHRARNRAAGLPAGHARLRYRYAGIVGPWWDLLNVAVADVGPLVEGTGWAVERHLTSAVDHYLLLRRDEIMPRPRRPAGPPPLR